MAYQGSIIVTGGTVNLGYYTALHVAKAYPNFLVVLSSRSDKENAAGAINKTLGQKNTVFIPLDLASKASVRNYAKQWTAQHRPPIHILLLNAGLQFPGDLTTTADGIEATFGINHVGNAALFHFLWPHIADDARIVLTSSGTHDPAQKTGLADATYTTAEDLAHPPAHMIKIDGRQRYSSSKLANVLWTYALDRRLSQLKPPRNITVNAMDPGLMPGTGLAREASALVQCFWTHVMPRTIPVLRVLLSPNVHTAKESGAALARLAIASDSDVKKESGLYFEGLKAIPSSKDSYDELKQDDLWKWTVQYLAESDEEAASFSELR